MFASGTQLPSGAHASVGQSESFVQARHEFPSHTGVVPEQSDCIVHWTHAPLDESHTGVLPNAEQSALLPHAPHVRFTRSHTGAPEVQASMSLQSPQSPPWQAGCSAGQSLSRVQFDGTHVS